MLRVPPGCAFRSAVGLLVLILSTESAVAQQSDRGSLVVGVRDAASGAFLVGAQVSVRAAGAATTRASARSDSLGRAVFSALPPGRFTIEARHLGFAPKSADVEVSGADTAEVVLLLTAVAQRLPTTLVRDSSPSKDWRPWAEGFEHRRRTRAGRFMDEESIRRALGTDLKTFLEARIPAKIRQGYVISTRGPNSIKKACRALIYLDGVRLSDGRLTAVTFGFIGAMEYYSPGTEPVQYRESSAGGEGGSAACGVLLIWTR